MSRRRFMSKKEEDISTTGVYIYTSFGKLIPYMLWQNQGTPVGIYVLSDLDNKVGRNFIVSLSCIGRAKGDVTNSGITSLTDHSLESAKLDFEGKSNFATLVTKSTSPNNSTAVGIINSYAYENIGAGNWYMPSGGQIMIINQYFDDIKAAYNKIGKTLTINHIIYTSTRCTYISGSNENTNYSCFAPDIYVKPASNRNVRFTQWPDIYYLAITDKPD